MPSVRRVLLLGLGVVVLAAAVFFALVDDTRGAVGAAVVAAGIVLLASWARSAAFPGPQWVVLALILGGVGVIGPALIAAGVFVALVTLKVVASMGFARRLRRVELGPVPPEVVMEGAEGVANLEAEGFWRLGGHRMRVSRTLLTTTVLVGRDDDRLANVTDRVWEVASRFGRRWLITISSGLAPLPADVLRQDVGGDDPSHVARAHEAALQLLARRGVRPDRFGNDTEVLEAAREIDLRSIRFVAHASLAVFLRLEARVRISDHALVDDDSSRRRIDAWLAAEPAA
jgi:hypothetical protein